MYGRYCQESTCGDAMDTEAVEAPGEGEEYEPSEAIEGESGESVETGGVDLGDVPDERPRVAQPSSETPGMVLPKGVSEVVGPPGEPKPASGTAGKGRPESSGCQVLDYWEPSVLQKAWIRHHVRERKAVFEPIDGSVTGPATEELSDVRITF